MIIRLKLTNFKKVEDDTMVFRPGLTALKGANESSKTTRFHAIVYAFFGARALPLTLAETVTYDKPEASLKVELDFVFEGSTYKIVRSKSGAVISNSVVSANGQTEVTKFVERLFGINADSATKLMIASQNGLRGALESGEAVPLIEKLANIDLIDNLIGKVQEQLPSGSTSSLVAAIAEIDRLEEPKLDTGDLEPSVQFHRNVVALAANELEVLLACDTVDEAYHRTNLNKISAKIQQKSSLEKNLLDLTSSVSVPVQAPTVDIEVLRLLNETSSLNRLKRSAYNLFCSFEQTQSYLEGNYEDLIKENTTALAEATKALGLVNAGIAAATARRITESFCGLCGKDLQDVPEVVSKNSQLDLELTILEEARARHLQRVEDETQKQGTLVQFSTAAKAVHSIASRLQGYTELDTAVYPPRLKWVGDEDLTRLDCENYEPELAAAERARELFGKAMAVREFTLEKIKSVQEELASIVIDEKSKADSEFALSSKKILAEQLRLKQSEVYSAKLHLKDAEHALSQAKDRYNVELESYTKSQASKLVLLAALQDTQKNNLLIKKLREVRPVVATRLWAIVLASVSNYFSRIRGEPTIITRTPNGFQANGRAVEGLSGSTLDALGLAIRMALGKTFLPSVGFLLLDEPSAGMDDARETAMLGLLSTVDYEQVIVVTHSSLADSFASNVISL